MNQDNSQKDPQDTTQGGGNPPQDQPVEPTQAPAEAPAVEPAPEAPAEEKPTEAPAVEPAPETPAEEKPTEPAVEPAPEAPVEEKPAEAPAVEPAPEAPAEEKPAEAPAVEPAPETPAEEKPAEEPAVEPAPETPAEEKPASTPIEETKPAETAPKAEPEAKPAEAATTEATSAPADDCGCPTVTEAEWDKQKKTIDKAFYKTWSPRLFFYPFSFAIDLGRAKQGALNQKYTVPENGMILDTGGMFWSTIMVEVEGENAEDKNVISLKGKEVYTKVSKKPWKEIGSDIEELKKELGKEPTELYLWYTSCPKCTDKKEVKTVLIAVQ